MSHPQDADTPDAAEDLGRPGRVRDSQGGARKRGEEGMTHLLNLIKSLVVHRLSRSTTEINPPPATP